MRIELNIFVNVWNIIVPAVDETFKLILR